MVWIRRIIVLSLFGALVYSYFSLGGWERFKATLQETGTDLRFSRNDSFLNNWDSQEIKSLIDSYRKEASLSAITWTDEMDQQAMMRLANVLTWDDYVGSATGLTREKAAKNALKDISWVGDLVLLDFFKSNNPLEFWLEDKISKENLVSKDWTSGGVAVRNDDEKVQLYVLLAAKRAQGTKSVAKKISWGGIDLWNALNDRRVQMGVNPLKTNDALCTIASIRLNQLLDLDKLDGHAGFSGVLDREDLKWIKEKYNVSEFLVSGYPTPEESVKAWENTLGHRKVVIGGEYVWGCTYAQDGFGVAIAAY